MLLCIALVLTIGLVPGNAEPSFTASDPESNTRTVGETFRVVCDSNTTGIQPLVSANGATVADVTPQGIDSNIRTYESNVLTRENNGAVFTCTAGNNVQIGSMITLNVQFPPLITGVNNITVDKGDQASLNVTIDANPPVTLGGISVTPNLPATTVFGVVNANTVSITIPNVAAEHANVYTITASNSVGNDTESFVLTVNQMTPTPSPSSTVQTQQVTTTENTAASDTRSTSYVAATMSSTDMPPSPSPTGETTFNSGKSMLASATIVLFLLCVLFFIN